MSSASDDIDASRVRSYVVNSGNVAISLQQYFIGDEVWLDIDNRGDVRCLVILPRQDSNDWSYRLREVGENEDLDGGRWVPQNEKLRMAKRGPRNPKFKGATLSN